MNQTFSFPDAIARSQEIMQQMNDNQLSEAEIENAVASVVATQASARGFFVAYLTDDLPLADNPSEGVIKGLRSSPAIVSDLLVKNVAMSAAMRVTHLRNEDATAAAGSERVKHRSINLIEQLKLPQINSEIKDLQSTIMEGEGNYQEFLARWGYDEEQQSIISQALSAIDASDTELS